MEKKVLIVDDDLFTRRALRFEIGKMLGYACHGAVNGRVALDMIRKYRFQAVLLDAAMPVMDGLGFLKAYREEHGFNDSPNIILMTEGRDPDLEARAEGYGVADLLRKPVMMGELVHKVAHWMNREVESLWRHLDPEQERILRLTMQTIDRARNGAAAGADAARADLARISEFIADTAGTVSAQALLNAVNDHDDYTFVHSLRTGFYLSLFALAQPGFRRRDAATLALGGVLHDIGKTRTPLAVLNKGGSFGADEWRVMRQHVNHSVDVLMADESVAGEVIDIAWCHHERLDGSGYPRGLKGPRIDLLPRMASIVDAYVALTDRRPYKPAYSQEHSFEILESAPHHFDRHMVADFRRAVGA